MENLDKLFENIYKETHCTHLTEISVGTIADRIKKRILNNTVATDGTEFGKKYAQNPYNNTLQCDTKISDTANIERFSPNSASAQVNTLLAETYFIDTTKKFNSANAPLVRTWFEAFYKEIKKAGVPFAPFTKLNVA